ncbi:MAG TPA: hypothetical protein V6D15_08375, partial [Oculatellaceae cyanobacterium]
YFAILIGIQGIKKRLKLLLSCHKFKTALVFSIHYLKVLNTMQGKLPQPSRDRMDLAVYFYQSEASFKQLEIKHKCLLKLVDIGGITVSKSV